MRRHTFATLDLHQWYKQARSFLVAHPIRESRLSLAAPWLYKSMKKSLRNREALFLYVLVLLFV